jgi:DNA-directed RNA polymerase specialized sigma24 family protein
MSTAKTITFPSTFTGPSSRPTNEAANDNGVTNATTDWALVRARLLAVISATLPKSRAQDAEDLVQDALLAMLESK